MGPRLSGDTDSSGKHDKNVQDFDNDSDFQSRRATVASSHTAEAGLRVTASHSAGAGLPESSSHAAEADLRVTFSHAAGEGLQ